MGKKHKKHHKSDEAGEDLGHAERQLQKDPIRLVLKVGHSHGYSPAASPAMPPPVATTAATAAAAAPSTPVASSIVDDDRKHKHHKKSKKKKKKRDRSRDGTDDGVAPLGTSTPATATERLSRQPVVGELLPESSSTPSSRKRPAPPPSAADQPPAERRSLREPRQCTLGGSRDEPIPVNALNETLNYIHRLMQKRDNNGFFSFPVNDTIAPGYSTIIAQPMDLSTMKGKIDGYVYRNVMEYKADLKLICVNAMTYNHPETVYYKAAQKLLEYGMRTLSKERLSSWRKSMPFMATIADQELALDQDVDASDYVAPVRVQKKEKIKNYLHFEPIPDNLPAKDILALAQEAARAAADELSAKRPRSKMGILRLREDGTTTLNFLNPDASGIVSEKERIITIGQMAGKLQHGCGTWSLTGFKEDEKNKAVPVTYLNYGPFASHAPSYDSAFANLTKEETNLLLSAYGSEAPMNYARSVMDFVAGADDHVIKLADALLDTLTTQKHGAAVRALNECREKQQKEAESSCHDATPSSADAEASQSSKDAQGEVSHADAASGATASKSAVVDFSSLRSLSSLGIDVSFLDSLEQQQAVQSKLSRTSSALQELERLQDGRLSRQPQPLSGPTSSLHGVPERWPSDAEVKLALDVTRELSLLAKQVNPGDIVNTDAVHSALGLVNYGSEAAVASNDSATSGSGSATPAVTGGASVGFPSTPADNAGQRVASQPATTAASTGTGSEDPLDQLLRGSDGIAF